MQKIQHLFSVFFLVLLLVLCSVVVYFYSSRDQSLSLDFTTQDLMKYSEGSGLKFTGDSDLRVWLFALDRPDLRAAQADLEAAIHKLPEIVWLSGSQKQERFTQDLKRLNYYRSVAGNTPEGFARRLKELQGSGISGEEMNHIIAEDPLLLDYASPVSSFNLTPEGRLSFRPGNADMCGGEQCLLFYGEIDRHASLESLHNAARELDAIKVRYEEAGGSVTVVNHLKRSHDFLAETSRTLICVFLAVLATAALALFYLYRSLRPFAEMLLSLTFSYGLAIMAVWGFLGHLHIMTLFFSLVFWIPGIDIYLNFNNARESGRLRRNHIRGVWGSMLITLVIYGTMAQIGFRIFSELAVIALFFISLFCILYGVLVHLPPARYRGHYRIYRAIGGLRRFLTIQGVSLTLVIALALVSAYGLMTAADGLIFNYAREGAADKVARITASGRDLTGYEVSASSPEVLDSRMTRLREWLDGQIAANRIGYYLLPFDMVISEKVALMNQERNRDLYERTRELRDKAGLQGELPVIPGEQLRGLLADMAAAPAMHLFFPENDEGVYRASLVVFREQPGFYNDLRREFAWAESRDQVSSYIRSIAPQSADIIIFVTIIFVILAAVIYVLRGVSSFAGLTLPVFTGLGCAGLAMNSFSVNLSLFSILIILLVSGITFDFAVFSRRAGRYRDRRAGITVLVSVFISESMFVYFLCSGIPVFRMTGAVMIAGITAGAVSAVLLNMFILSSGRGRLRAVLKKRKAAKAAAAAQAALPDAADPGEPEPAGDNTEAPAPEVPGDKPLPEENPYSAAPASENGDSGTQGD